MNEHPLDNENCVYDTTTIRRHAVLVVDRGGRGEQRCDYSNRTISCSNSYDGNNGAGGSSCSSSSPDRAGGEERTVMISSSTCRSSSAGARSPRCNTNSPNNGRQQQQHQPPKGNGNRRGAYLRDDSTGTLDISEHDIHTGDDTETDILETIVERRLTIARQNALELNSSNHSATSGRSSSKRIRRFHSNNNMSSVTTGTAADVLPTPTWGLRCSSSTSSSSSSSTTISPPGGAGSKSVTIATDDPVQQKLLTMMENDAQKKQQSMDQTQIDKKITNKKIGKEKDHRVIIAGSSISDIRLLEAKLQKRYGDCGGKDSSSNGSNSSKGSGKGSAGSSSNKSSTNTSRGGVVVTPNDAAGNNDDHVDDENRMIETILKHRITMARHRANSARSMYSTASSSSAYVDGSEYESNDDEDDSCTVRTGTVFHPERSGRRAAAVTRVQSPGAFRVNPGGRSVRLCDDLTKDSNHRSDNSNDEYGNDQNKDSKNSNNSNWNDLTTTKEDDCGLIRYNGDKDEEQDHDSVTSFTEEESFSTTMDDFPAVVSVTEGLSAVSTMSFQYSQSLESIMEGQTLSTTLSDRYRAPPTAPILAVASEVHENDEEIDAVAKAKSAPVIAVEYDPEDNTKNKADTQDSLSKKHPCYRNWHVLFFLASTIVVALVVGITAGMVFNDSSVEEDSTVLPDETDEFRSAVTSVVGDIDELRIPQSPYRKALDWIKDDDPMQLDPRTSPNFIQRYIVAYFYFATTVKGPWRSCNPPDDAWTGETLCQYESLTQSRFNLNDTIKIPSAAWLSNSNECDWAGLACDSNGQIESIDLAGSGLSGTFPEGLGNLPFLTKLNFNLNKLEGSLPIQIVDTEQLISLQLGYNAFTGTIPTTWWNARKLMHFDIGNNQLEGTIPTEIGNLRDVKYFYANSNHLSGILPSEIGLLNSIADFDVTDNRLKGPIPSTIHNWGDVKRLSFRANQLSGPIFDEIGKLTNLVEIYLDGNFLSGSLPDSFYELSNLEFFDARHCRLSGTISPKISHMKKNLWVFQISHNKFYGSLPSEFGALSNLNIVELEGNAFTGIIPQELCSSRRDKLEYENKPGLVELTADCAPDKHDYIELSCSCCTSCCDPDGKKCLQAE